MVDIKIDPVMGPQLLESITSSLYEDPIIIFREYVQNSVDAYNWEIEKDKSKEFENFCVDIKIDRRRHSIQIFDNGYGIPKEQFLNEMTNIGKSEKPKFKNLIGFRGIGRLSAMPSCKRLIFTNKPKGSNILQHFIWNGDRFHELLNRGEEPDLATMIRKIVDYSDEIYPGDINKHFFQVEIKGYKEEINELIATDDFKKRLCILLPLKYSPNFKHQEEIKAEYQNYMNQSLDTFSFIVRLDNEVLYKPYTDKDILESGIVFWKLKLGSTSRSVAEEKIGVLWFTFDRKIERKKDEPYGIYVRPKNMLMGDKYSLADDTARSKTDYVTTPRELYQQLNGVCGEMFIHSTRLNENARRDWFRIDEEFLPLRNIIVDFMRRLKNYRYTASRYFKNRADKDKLVNAYTELTNFESKRVVSAINAMKKEVAPEKEILKYADEDIPAFPITIRRFYERLMKCLYEHFKNKSKVDDFIRLRAFLKKDLNRDQ